MVLFVERVLKSCCEVHCIVCCSVLCCVIWGVKRYSVADICIPTKRTLTKKERQQKTTLRTKITFGIDNGTITSLKGDNVQ